MANDWRETVDAVIDLQADEMNTEPGPSLQWYPQQWLGDQMVALMDFQAQGVHHHLLMIAWKGFDLDEDPIPCSIPDDPDLIGDLVKLPEWDSCWRQVARAWKRYKGRLWNVGLCRSYIHQMQNRRGAKKAADARWGNAQCATDANASKKDANASRTDAESRNAQPSSPPSSPPSSIQEERGEPPQLPGVEVATDKQQRYEKEVAAIVDVYYEEKARWHQRIRKPPPRRVKLAPDGRKLIARHLRAGKTVEDLTVALRNVGNSAWHLGLGNGAKGPRLKISDVFNWNSKVNAIEILIEATTRDRECNPFRGGS